MKTILFQGDSITDAGRNKENPTDLGQGYPCLVASALGRKYPESYSFINRGISGNKVTDLIGRWKRDCINLKPDYLSILIGVNDVWHELGGKDGTDTETFEAVYDILLSLTKKHLPDTKILLMEPYVLGDALSESERDAFTSLVEEKCEAVRRLAKKHALPVLSLPQVFEKALQEADALYWTGEGVHPTHAGHQLICDAWIEAFENL